jgi:hypothetical protein
MVELVGKYQIKSKFSLAEWIEQNENQESLTFKTVDQYQDSDLTEMFDLLCQKNSSLTSLTLGLDLTIRHAVVERVPKSLVEGA